MEKIVSEMGTKPGNKRPLIVYCSVASEQDV